MEVKKREKRTQRIRVRRLVFALAFAVGFVIMVSAMLDNFLADRTYDKLRTQAHSVILEPDAQVNGDKNLPNQVPDQIPNEKNSSMNFQELIQFSPYMKAWLFSEGTLIDYPVMQAADNSYYLDHLYTGEENRVGSLFVDYRNTGYFTDKNTVIYGHNLHNGSMFYSLCEYKRQAYYDEFPVMWLFTPDGDYILEIFSGTVENGAIDSFQFNFKNGEAFMEYINGYRERSMFQSQVEVTAQDRIVSLCTCSYETDDSRFVVLGKLVPIIK